MLNYRRLTIGIIIPLACVIIVRWVYITRGHPDPLKLEPYKVKGNPSAQISLIIFSDFQCPYCKNISHILNDVQKTHPNDVKIVFKHYPLSIHSYARIAAEASECAGDQGKFWEYHDQLFQHASSCGSSENIPGLLDDFGRNVGLNIDQFKKCMTLGEKKKIVEENLEEGRHYFVAGTPTILLNGNRVVTDHDPETINKLIEQVIKSGVHK